MKRTWLTLGILAATMLTAVPRAQAALYWTPWVSEENNGPWTACTYWNEAAVGWGCSGSYCDNIRMLCETFQNGMTLDPASDKHVGWFSEETGEIPGIAQFPPPNRNVGACAYSTLPPGQACLDYGCPTVPGVISGAHCRGSNCDDLEIECDQVVKYNGSTPVPATTSRCRSAGPYSEEQGSIDFGPNQYITSITCTGSYCDNKTMMICDFVAPF